MQSWTVPHLLNPSEGFLFFFDGMAHESECVTCVFIFAGCWWCCNLDSLKSPSVEHENELIRLFRWVASANRFFFSLWNLQKSEKNRKNDRISIFSMWMKRLLLTYTRVKISILCFALWRCYRVQHV